MSYVRYRFLTAAEFTTQNPTLAPNELGIESDTGKAKVGNGSDAWNALSYQGGDPAVDVVNNLTEGGAAKALSAQQGVVLKSAVDNAASTAATAATAAGNAQSNAAAAVTIAATAAANAAAVVQDNLTPSAVKAPSVNAVNEAIAAIDGGGGVVRVAGSSVIPLNLAGNGKAMPLTAGDTILVNTDLTPTVGAGEVPDGVCSVDYLLAANLILTNFVAKGDTPTVGHKARVTYASVGGDHWALVSLGAAIDVTAPLLGTPHVENSARNLVYTPITELSTPSLNGVPGGVTLSGAAAAGRTVLDVAVGGSDLITMLSSPLGAGDVLNIAFAAGMVKDTAGNLSAAKGATAVTNNIAVPAPNAPTIAAGASTNSTQALTITPGAVDGSHGAAATYTVQYKKAADPTYTSLAPAASLTPTVTGLDPSTGYNYKVFATNAGGPSATSAVLTVSTSAAAGALSITGLFETTAADLTALGTLDWIALRASSGASQDQRKAVANLITGPTLTNMVRVSGYGGAPTLSFTDAAGTAVGTNSDEAAVFNVVSSASLGLTDFTIPVGTVEETFAVFLGTYVDSGHPGTPTLRLSLSDSSAPPQSSAVSVADSTRVYSMFTFKARAGIAGQSVTVRIENPIGGTPEVVVQAIAAKLS
jgi:hypothetical protein